MEGILKRIYYDVNDPGSYGGVDRLFKRAKEEGAAVTREKVKQFLRNERTYSLHKPMRRNFVRNRTIVHGIDSQWQADLADMQDISEANGGNKYILTGIDVFTKFAWAIPIKSKGSKTMLDAFKRLFAISKPRKPKYLQTDKGTEFLNADVQKYLKQQKIKHFTTNSDKKAAVVERLNRTLKSRIWRYFSAKQTHKYIEVLNSIVDSYNNSKHRSIGTRPSNVNAQNELEIWNRLYGKIIKDKNDNIANPGQLVRISRLKGNFEKGYLPNWSEEHFTVKDYKSKDRGVYKLVDYDQEPIEGDFYKEEIQPIDRAEYLVEKVIRKRKRGASTELFVKWFGWPNKFNSWIKETDIEHVYNQG